MKHAIEPSENTAKKKNSDVGGRMQWSQPKMLDLDSGDIEEKTPGTAETLNVSGPS